jgi:hypothetical protein
VSLETDPGTMPDPVPSSDPVVEAYKRHVDRTLLRRNLQRSPSERVANLTAVQRLAAAALLLAVLVACGPQDAPDETGIGQPLPDTFPVTGVGSDLPDGMPLPPEGSSTPPETDTTRTQPH